MLVLPINGMCAKHVGESLMILQEQFLVEWIIHCLLGLLSNLPISLLKGGKGGARPKNPQQN